MSKLDKLAEYIPLRKYIHFELNPRLWIPDDCISVIISYFSFDPECESDSSTCSGWKDFLHLSLISQQFFYNCNKVGVLNRVFTNVNMNLHTGVYLSDTIVSGFEDRNRDLYFEGSFGKFLPQIFGDEILVKATPKECIISGIMGIRGSVEILWYRKAPSTLPEKRKYWSEAGRIFRKKAEKQLLPSLKIELEEDVVKIESKNEGKAIRIPRKKDILLRKEGSLFGVKRLYGAILYLEVKILGLNAKYFLDRKSGSFNDVEDKKYPGAIYLS